MKDFRSVAMKRSKFFRSRVLLWRVTIHSVMDPSNAMVMHHTLVPLVTISGPYSCTYVQICARKTPNRLGSPLKFMPRASVLHPLPCWHCSYSLCRLDCGARCRGNCCCYRACCYCHCGSRGGCPIAHHDLSQLVCRICHIG